ncbi:hypothetical protein SOVF_055870 [Spinacia oleracea]|nr:hypothetical protein SOVF_055870 [Spinacia oleracea]
MEYEIHGSLEDEILQTGSTEGSKEWPKNHLSHSAAYYNIL